MGLFDNPFADKFGVVEAFRLRNFFYDLCVFMCELNHHGFF